MNQLKCQSSGCHQRPTMHFTRAEGRRATEVIQFCDSHARLHFRERYDQYCSLSRVGPGRPLALGNGVAFDIAFAFWDELQEPRPWGRCHVELLEIGGRRRFGFAIGNFEWDALDRELGGYASLRPLTHQAMAAAMAALGGRLQYVEIDKFFPSHQTYEAKLHVQQMNMTLAVDVRPSDALVLAVICDVPIIVSNDVLEALDSTRWLLRTQGHTSVVSAPPRGFQEAASEPCIVAGCRKTPVVHVHRAWDHRIGQVAHCCADDIKGFLDFYYEMHIVGEGTPRSWRGGVVFDIEMVLYDERPDKPCQFSLREVGGGRRLDCRIGPFDAASLLRELERVVAPRPLTHRAMASSITALGGQLDCVVIEKFFPGQKVAYEAKLHIRQLNNILSVDVRPNDAVVLAVICGVPVVVSKDVLVGLGETER